MKRARILGGTLLLVAQLTLGLQESAAQRGGVSVQDSPQVFAIVSPRIIEMERLIRRRLAAPVSFQVDSVTLDQTLDIFRARFGLNINLDLKAMQDAGFLLDSLVQLHVQNETARLALYRLLDTYDLTWVTTDNGLLITSKAKADDRLETRVYPVADLVAQRTPEGLVPDFDSLIVVITSTVHPTTWTDVGGPGAIRPFAPALSLIVSQSQSAHEQLENLLVVLRASRDWQRIAHDAPTPSSTVSTDSFLVPANHFPSSAPNVDRSHLLPPQHERPIAPHSGGGYFQVPSRRP